MEWVRQVVLLGQGNQLLTSELELFQALFFSVLVAKEIDGIGRFRAEKKLYVCVRLAPSAHASGVFHGRITKTNNEWLRQALKV